MTSHHSTQQVEQLLKLDLQKLDPAGLLNAALVLQQVAQDASDQCAYLRRGLRIDLQSVLMCPDVAEFAPLGGERRDCAVVGSSLFSSYEGHILPCDVIEGALAVLCMPPLWNMARPANMLVPPPKKGLFTQPNSTETLFKSHQPLKIGVRVRINSAEEAHEFTKMTLFDDCPFLEVDLRTAQVTALPDQFSCRRVRRISFPASLTQVGHTFLQCASVVRVDLSSTGLTALPDMSISNCVQLIDVKLPPSLRSIGDSVFSHCRELATINIESTQVEVIGRNFMTQRTNFMTQPTVYNNSAKSVYTELILPRTLCDIGTPFIRSSSIVTIDMSATQIKDIKDGAVAELASLIEVRFPNTLQIVGDNVLFSCPKVQVIDLSHTAVTRIGHNFAKFDEFRVAFDRVAPVEMSFPAGICSIGDRFLAARCVKSININATQLESVGECFMLSTTGVTEVIMPPTLRGIGPHFMQNSRDVQMIDLSATQLTHISDNFCSAAGGAGWLATVGMRVRLPVCVDCIGDNFLKDRVIDSLNISTTQVRRIGKDFAAACSGVTEISMPSTVVEIGPGLFQRSRSLEQVDLSNTQVSDLKGKSMQSCIALSEVRLPASLAQVSGDYVLSHCGKLTRVALPNSLKLIGINFMINCPRLDDTAKDELAALKISGGGGVADNAFAANTSHTSGGDNPFGAAPNPFAANTLTTSGGAPNPFAANTSTTYGAAINPFAANTLTTSGVLLIICSHGTL